MNRGSHSSVVSQRGRVWGTALHIGPETDNLFLRVSKGEDGPARLQLEFTQLKEQLALLQQRLFGASSEKRPPAAEATPPPKARKQRGHGPRAQPELPVQEVMLPLDEADKVCGLCGGALKEWTGQTEDSQEVSVVERHFVLKRYRRQK